MNDSERSEPLPDDPIEAADDHQSSGDQVDGENDNLEAAEAVSADETTGGSDHDPLAAWPGFAAGPQADPAEEEAGVAEGASGSEVSGEMAEDESRDQAEDALAAETVPEAEPEPEADHWGELAEQVGAETPPAPMAVPEAAIESESVAPSGPPPVAQKKKSRPQPKVEATDWGSLAGELGLEVPEGLLEPPEETGGDDATEEEDLPRVVPETAEDTSPDLSVFSQPGDDDTADAGYDDEPVSETADEFDPLALWDQPPTETGSDSPAEAQGDIEPIELERESTESEADLDGEEDAEESMEDADEAPRRRGRRRRRRRRGSETTSDEQVDSGEEAEQDEDAEEEEAPRPPRKRRESARSERSSEGDDDAEKHRKIPTWYDAISVVVQANMDSRSRPSGGGRRGRGRGRSGGNR